MLTDTMLDACAEFEKEVNDPLALRQAQVYFPKNTSNFIESYFINRTRTCRGASGDYMTLELAYKNMPMSAGIGAYLDKYVLSNEIATAVRDRL